jgi:phage terminase small subunit
LLVPDTTPDASLRTASSLVPEECPDVLNADGRILWQQFVTQRAVSRILAPVMLMYIEAYLSWQRATREIHARGDYGKLGAKPVANPFLRLRRDAEFTMLVCLRTLGWQTTDPPTPVPVQAPKSRLDLFIAARG